jgi:pimeloyl-ACP methyl ester carboxylesterase
MQVGGMTWTVRVAGRGRPVLFLHGFSGSGLSWAGIAGLGSRFRAVVPDLPGHGATGWEGGPPDGRPRASVERTADDLAAIVRRLGAERVDVVGYSMGARIALRLAVAHPEVVGRLVLEAPSAGIADPAARAQRAAADAEPRRSGMPSATSSPTAADPTRPSAGASSGASARRSSPRPRRPPTASASMHSSSRARRPASSPSKRGARSAGSASLPARSTSGSSTPG